MEFPPPPTTAVRTRNKSLGTAVLAQEKKFDSDSDSDHNINIFISAPLSSGPPQPWFPPPPTMPTSTSSSANKKVRIREPPNPAADLPSLPTLPRIAYKPPPAPVDVPQVFARKPVGRAKSRRKTILQAIDGWWDLGLLDKRKTMLAQQSAAAGK
jgi:hypothetical protein